MTDEPENGERGTVNPGGSIGDRKDIMPLVLIGLMVVQFVLVSVAIAVGAIIVSDLSQATAASAKAAKAANAATARLDDAVRGSCQRVQVERERSNVVEASLFQTLTAASLASRDPVARRIYRNQADAAAWSPPANCQRAVNDPESYRPPRSIAFSDLPDDYAERLIVAAKRGQPQPLP